VRSHVSWYRIDPVVQPSFWSRIPREFIGHDGVEINILRDSIVQYLIGKWRLFTRFLRCPMPRKVESHWVLTTKCLGRPATALMSFGCGGLAGVVVVVSPATVFDDGGFAEGSLTSPGMDGKGRDGCTVVAVVSPISPRRPTLPPLPRELRRCFRMRRR